MEIFSFHLFAIGAAPRRDLERSATLSATLLYLLNKYYSHNRLFFSVPTRWESLQVHTICRHCRFFARRLTRGGSQLIDTNFQALLRCSPSLFSALAEKDLRLSMKSCMSRNSTVEVSFSTHDSTHPCIHFFQYTKNPCY